MKSFRLCIASRGYAALVLSLAAGLLLGSPNPSAAQDATRQWLPGKWMTQAVARVMGSVRGINQMSNYGYDHGVCIMAAFLKQDGKVAMDRRFEAGKRYVILGGGDEDVQDLDITILDSTGKVLASDTKADAVPVVFFTPPRSGTYTVRQHLYRARRGAFCVVAVLREGGWDVPLQNLATATGNLAAMCNRVDQMTTRKVKFRDATNQWALYGSVLRQGSEAHLTNLALGLGQRVALAAGDANARDIDLWVLDEGGGALARDVDRDATPVVSFQAGLRPSHGLKFKNVAARGPALVLAVVLDLFD